MASRSVEWLNPDEQHMWRSYQAMSTVLEAMLERQLQRDAGMPHAYYTILVILADSPERSCRVTALADATFTSQSRMSHAVTALEKRGWVRRERCDEDSRVVLAVLTSAGRRALKLAAAGHVSQVRASVFDHLTPTQVKTFDQVCSTLLAAMDSQQRTLGTRSQA